LNPVITTFTGKRVNPLDLRDEDICIEDIAHALAMCNRFAGHTKIPISVAQHSCFVAELCEGDYERQALLHDASEAYLGDVTKWLKHSPSMAGYREAEERAQVVIYTHFGCDTKTHESVWAADKFMVRLEAHHGFGPDFQFNHPDYLPVTKEERTQLAHWEPWHWERSENEFLYLARLFQIAK
jgi:hypothetical protein